MHWSHVDIETHLLHHFSVFSPISKKKNNWLGASPNSEPISGGRTSRCGMAVICYSLLLIQWPIETTGYSFLKFAIEIVDLPNFKMVIFAYWQEVSNKSWVPRGKKSIYGWDFPWTIQLWMGIPHYGNTQSWGYPKMEDL